MALHTVLIYAIYSALHIEVEIVACLLLLQKIRPLLKINTYLAIDQQLYKLFAQELSK